jgi:tetratricopeptide (TPR) repeat protein
MNARMVSPGAMLILIGLALFLGVPLRLQAYINAGFRSQRDYDTYLRYKKTVQTTLAPYSAAIERNFKDAVAYYQRARAWESLPAYNGPWPDNQRESRLDRSYQALQDYNQAIAWDASFGRAYLRRSALLWEARQYTRAIQDVRKTIRLEPKWALAHAYLATCYLACPEKEYRDQAKALKHATRADRLSGQRNSACLQVLAAVHASAGDFRAAVKWQSKAVPLLADSRARRGSPDPAALDIRAHRRLVTYKEQRANPSPFTLCELEEAAPKKTRR